MYILLSIFIIDNICFSWRERGREEEGRTRFRYCQPAIKMHGLDQEVRTHTHTHRRVKVRCLETNITIEDRIRR